jgi:hypothetical protein
MVAQVPHALKLHGVQPERLDNNQDSESDRLIIR